MKQIFERFKREWIKSDNILEEKIEKENLFFKWLKDCWMMLFLILNFKNERTREDFSIKFEERVSKIQKFWKYLKWEIKC